MIRRHNASVGGAGAGGGGGTEARLEASESATEALSGEGRGDLAGVLRRVGLICRGWHISYCKSLLLAVLPH